MWRWWGLLSLPFVAGFWRLFQEIRRGGHPDIGMMLSLVLPLIPIILVLVLVGLVTDLVLRDWMMPHYPELLAWRRAQAAAKVSKKKEQFHILV